MKTEEIISIFCLCSDFCKDLKIKDHPNAKMAHSEVITVGILSALYFGGNLLLTRQYCLEFKLFTSIISREELTRRLLNIPQGIWACMIAILARAAKKQCNDEYIIDSFPIPFCHPCRSKLCKIAHGKEYLGYCASKKMYYYGMKAHVLVNRLGQLVELKITPARFSDTSALEFMDMNLPKGSILYGDKAYNSYQKEDKLFKKNQIRILAQRRKNLKRQHSPEENKRIKKYRKRVETAISAMIRKFPRAFYVRSLRGFQLRAILCIIAPMLSLCGALSH